MKKLGQSGCAVLLVLLLLGTLASPVLAGEGDQHATGTEYTDVLRSDSKTQYYAFTIPYSGLATITFTSKGSTSKISTRAYGFSVSLLDSAQQPIAYKKCDAAASCTMDGVALRQGTVLLGVKNLDCGFDYNISNFSYKITVEPFPAGYGQVEYENNDAPARATPIDPAQAVRGSMRDNTDCDYYSFTVPAGKKASLKLEHPAVGVGDVVGLGALASYYWDFALVSGQGATLESQLSAISETSKLTTEVEVPAGTYYARVRNAKMQNGRITWEGSGMPYCPVGYQLSLVLADVEKDKDKDEQGAEESKVTLPKGRLYVAKGKSLKLPALIEPASAKKDIIWVAGNKKISVDANGRVKGLKPGTARVFAKSKATGKTLASCNVTVLSSAVKLESISAPARQSVKKGRVAQLKAKPRPANATGLVWKYTSSNKKVATVDALGRVTAKAKGKSRITIKCGKYKQVVEVTVK